MIFQQYLKSFHISKDFQNAYKDFATFQKQFLLRVFSQAFFKGPSVAI